MSKNMLIIIGIVLVLLIGGVLLINNSKSSAPTASPAVSENSNPTTAPAEMSPEAMIDASRSGDAMTTDSTSSGTVKQFTVMGSAFKFEPTTLTVNKGDKVKITFKNTGGTHDFVIDEFNVQ